MRTRWGVSSTSGTLTATLAAPIAGNVANAQMESLMNYEGMHKKRTGRDVHYQHARAH